MKSEFQFIRFPSMADREESEKKLDEFLNKEIEIRLPDFTPDFIVCSFDFHQMRNAIHKIETEGGTILSFCISSNTLKELEKMIAKKSAKIQDRIVTDNTMLGYRLIVSDYMNDKICIFYKKKGK